MKTINNYITEKLKITKNKRTEHTLFPTSRAELVDMISDEIKQNGLNCNLNHIDTSKILDMSKLFSYGKTRDFNGDISQWDVSNVINMTSMFRDSKFDDDISQWNVSNVKYMMEMFQNSDFNGDISDWDVSNVKRMDSMFYISKFNQDISNWKINPNCDIYEMFTRCSMENRYKPYKNGERIK